jgi:hypothetical protein
VAASRGVPNQPLRPNSPPMAPLLHHLQAFSRKRRHRRLAMGSRPRQRPSLRLLRLLQRRQHGGSLPLADGAAD